MDLISVASAIGASGFLIVTRDFWLARRTLKSSEKAEKRNEVREPLIVENIMLGNATKVAELFQIGITELEEAKKRLDDEFKETKKRLEDQLQLKNEELETVKKESESKSKLISDLYAKLGQQQIELDALRKTQA